MKVLEAVCGLCWPTARKMEAGAGRRWAVGSRAGRYSISCWSWRKQRVRTGRGRFSLQVSSPLSDSGTNTRVHGIDPCPEGSSPQGVAEGTTLQHAHPERSPQASRQVGKKKLLGNTEPAHGSGTLGLSPAPRRPRTPDTP